jgi:hypothetical protein
MNNLETKFQFTPTDIWKILEERSLFHLFSHALAHKIIVWLKNYPK